MLPPKCRTARSSLVFTACAAFALAACSAEVIQDGIGYKQVSESLCFHGDFYGSDAMRGLVSDALSAQGLGQSLVYAGAGTAIGEDALRGTAMLCNSGPSVLRQLSAPMSRDITGTCAIAATSDTLRSKRVGLDAGLVLTAPSNSLTTNIGKADLVRAFCALPDSSAKPCPTSLLIGAATFARFFREDDSSGTSDTLKAALGCTALCPVDAAHIIVRPVSLAVLAFRPTAAGVAPVA